MRTPAVVRPSALRFADQILDARSFRTWDTAPDQGPVSDAYAEVLSRAAGRSGADEAVTTGEGRVGGIRVALVLGEFDFLAGSIGRAAADRLLAAIRRATAERLPLVAAPNSGGTRMQEGTPAFVRMIGVARAVSAHKAAGLPYLVHLRHPTTGGVFASWASQGQVTTAEPGALIGFLGPRVFEALYGETFPVGIQSSENLVRHGVVDAVVGGDRLRALLTDVLRVVAIGSDERSGNPAPSPRSGDGTDVWASVLRTRDPLRPGLRELLAAADLVAPLSGTGAGERDDAVRLVLARFGGRPCVVVGHDRSAPNAVGPGGLRTARRAMRLAAGLRLPLVSVIDTGGAELSREAEEGALAGEISRCLEDMSALEVRTISVLLGQGTGGAALALRPADRVLAAEHAWLAPLPPEGASEILYRRTDEAARIAVDQRIGAADLLADGTVHRVVAEPDDGRGLIAAMASAIADELRSS
jgi:acetyl-CoA carboxylase carboxyl transferase subunit beta